MTLTCTTCEPFSNRSDSGISSLRQTWRLEFATATGVDASAVTVNFADVSVAVTSITVRIAVPAAQPPPKLCRLGFAFLQTAARVRRNCQLHYRVDAHRRAGLSAAAPPCASISSLHYRRGFQ